MNGDIYITLKKRMNKNKNIETMKNFILSMIAGIICICCSSCASSQSITADYERVYFDYVVSGHVICDDYVYDGTYSYHILSAVPVNVY